MSKEESSRGGLLSKVVRFVRNPTVDWSALDTLAVERESQFSKEALKELMERKRRNDFVRRREFAQLRQLRQRGMQQPQRNEEHAADPSCLSELNSPGERAATLQKIDEIEAQMSQQWWRGSARAARPCPTDGGRRLEDIAAARRHDGACLCAHRGCQPAASACGIFRGFWVARCSAAAT